MFFLLAIAAALMSRPSPVDAGRNPRSAFAPLIGRGQIFDGHPDFLNRLQDGLNRVIVRTETPIFHALAGLAPSRLCSWSTA